MKTALITGVTGQDGSYLAKLLLEKGYRVFGGFRRNASNSMWRLDELGVSTYQNLKLLEFDLTDAVGTLRAVESSAPDEVYNLAAQSFVGASFDQPAMTTNVTGLGALNLLEAIRMVNKKIRYYQASTSEMFGKTLSIPQNEGTAFWPRSPYGVAKLYAHWMTVNYRESYGMFAASGILFNHESPLRGLEFVTRKVTNGVAKLLHSNGPVLELGNLNARRDWGFAGEYVDGMYRMLQADTPDTFVLSTGKTSSIREFVALTFKVAGHEVEWRGEKSSEVGLVDGKIAVKVNPAYYRPAEVDLLVGDSFRAECLLGWKAMTTLEQLCAMMYDRDVSRIKELNK